jgi:hypothetical protein
MPEKRNGFLSRIKFDIKIISMLVGFVIVAYGLYDSLSKEIGKTETATQVLSITVTNNTGRIDILEASVAKSAQERRSADSLILDKLNTLTSDIRVLIKMQAEEP